MSNENECWSKMALSQSTWVQQMDSENELARNRIEQLERELAAEKALADRLHFALTNPESADINAVFTTYRKARGL